METKGWAVTLKDDDELFIPDFSVDGKFYNVMQIHSDKKSAEDLVKILGETWQASEVNITLSK